MEASDSESKASDGTSQEHNQQSHVLTRNPTRQRESDLHRVVCGKPYSIHAKKLSAEELAQLRISRSREGSPKSSISTNSTPRFNPSWLITLFSYPNSHLVSEPLSNSAALLNTPPALQKLGAQDFPGLIPMQVKTRFTEKQITIQDALLKRHIGLRSVVLMRSWVATTCKSETNARENITHSSMNSQ